MYAFVVGAIHNGVLCKAEGLLVKARDAFTLATIIIAIQHHKDLWRLRAK